jgi:hypothetical protein
VHSVGFFGESDQSDLRNHQAPYELLEPGLLIGASQSLAGFHRQDGGSADRPACYPSLHEAEHQVYDSIILVMVLADSHTGQRALIGIQQHSMQCSSVLAKPANLATCVDTEDGNDRPSRARRNQSIQVGKPEG